MAERQSPLVLDPGVLQAGLEKPILRDAQAAEVRSCLLPGKAGLRCHAWLHGAPGTGKTLTVRILLQEVTGSTGLRHVYVDCRTRFTFLAVVEAILNALEPLRTAVRSRESQVAVLLASLARRETVVALDELDVLPERDRWDLLHLLGPALGARLVVVTAGRETFLRLPEAVRSRVAPRLVLFPRFMPEEIREIVQRVAGRGLVPGALGKDALIRVADEAYGDARRAVALLRHMVFRAEAAGDKVIRAGHLRPGNAVVAPSQEEELAELSQHQRLLLELVASKPGIGGGELEAVYQKACQARGLEPVVSRTVDKYVADLVRRRLLHRERGAGTPGWVYRAGAYQG